MKRRDFLKIFSAGAAGTLLSRYPGSLFAQQPGSAPAFPNVILVMTDDQGYGDLACHGNPVINTPNIDTLYSQSVRLDNFHVDPTCSPTRSALMTGRYSCRVGVWHTIMGRSLLRKDEVTMADVFSDNGYHTAITGKWHLGDNYPFRPEHRGFHEILVHGGGGIGNTQDYWGNDYFDDTFRLNGVWTPYTGYCTDVFFSAAMDFIERTQNHPFFLYIPTNAPHKPFNVPASYSKPYKDLGVAEDLANFYGMITNIDENLGFLMQQLHDLGLEDNTILIFMTDNGTSKGNYTAGMRGKKGSEYDGGHRVPCFIRWRGQSEAGKDVDLITGHIDLLPTLIELCGLAPPDDGFEFDGTSIMPLLQGDGSGWPGRTLFVQRNRMEVPEPWTKSAVMTDQWRLVDRYELYDIQADPGQVTDVSALHPGVVTQLQTAYTNWFADVSERFDEYCEIILGSIENPTTLTAHDWHSDEVPWNHDLIADGSYYPNGFWAVEIERSGLYRFTLRQRPTHLNFPIEGITARLKINDFDSGKPIPSGALAVTFDVDLEAGKTTFQTWFYKSGGNSRGAYYIDVELLGGPTRANPQKWSLYK